MIYEFSDAAGTGNYIYEFVELYNDEGPNAITLSSLSAHAAAPWTGIALAGLLLGALVLVRRKR